MSAPVAGLRRSAGVVSKIISVLLVITGLALAVVSAIVAEGHDDAGLAALGVEAGAALWFGGAVALSILHATTVRRLLLLVAAGVGGVVLVVLALVLGWSGAGLTLAMEFGVGAVALVVVDWIILDVLQRRLQSIAGGGRGGTLTFEVTWSWPPIAVRTTPDHDPSVKPG